AYEQLFNYHWPGNVRELQNAVERAVLLCKGEEIDTQHLPAVRQALVVPGANIEPQPATTQAQSAPAASTPAAPAGNYTIEQLCRIIIQHLPDPQPGVQADELFKQMEVHLAQAAVERTKGNKQAAANLLGIYRPRLYSLLKKGAEQKAAAAAANNGAPA